MGAGGRMSIPPPTKQQDDDVRRVPCEKPPFTIGQLKKAIPPHCFNRSILRSFSYVVYDLAIVTLAYLFASSLIPQLPASLCLLAWPMYWVVQGCVLMGVWIVGHECGHHAFSHHTWLDDTVGFVLHSSLLVPYFSFKYSHRRHHSNIGSLERDEAFVPKPKSQVPWFSKYLNNPPGRFLSLTLILTLGWPLYLAFNATGRKYDRFACHYDPYGPIYNDSERAQIFISDVGVLLALSLLIRIAVAYGIAWVACVYGVPLLIMNGFVVVVTYLQHTHASLPHYDSSEWDWLRGALVTVDRDYGILNKVFHNVTNTHVAHHLFSTIPHYHAMEATKAIKPILGEYYKFDGTSVWRAMWREWRECLYVEPDDNDGSEYKGVFWYRNKL